MAPSIQDLIGQLAAEKPAEAFAAYRQLDEIATRATAEGHDARRTEVAAALAAELNAMTPPSKDEKGKEVPPQTKHKAATRGQICRLLAVVGGAAEVPALVQVLADLELREPARCALDRNPSDQATDALIKALDEVGTEFRIGVVGSLARRQGEKVRTALTKAASSDEEQEVRINAVEALAGFPEPTHADLILKATKAPCPHQAARAFKAAVRLAENLRKAGRKTEAADLYRRIGADGPEAQKAAARIGLEAAD